MCNGQGYDFRIDMAQSGTDHTASFAITSGEFVAATNVAHEYAIKLVDYIDRALLGTRHFRLKSGQLLRTLDEVILAILNDQLVW